MGLRRKPWMVGGCVALVIALTSGAFWLRSALVRPDARRLRTPGSEPALHVSALAPVVRSRVVGTRSSVSAPPSPPPPSTEASDLTTSAVAAVEPLDLSQGPAPVRRERHRLPDCPSALRLVGSAVNAGRPHLSRAVVRAGGGAFVVSAGGRVGDFIVETIRSASAELRGHDGERCALRSWVSPPSIEVQAPERAAQPEPRAEPKPKPVFSRQELAEGVRPLGGGAYQVARELLIKGMLNPGGAAGGAWFRAHVRDGRSVGMEVRAVREGSPLAALGIATGDVARSVNGIAIDSPDGLLEAFRAVREAKSITISIVRADAPRDLRYFVE